MTFLIALAAFALGWVALSRSREAQRLAQRMAALEKELRALRALLQPGSVPSIEAETRSEPRAQTADTAPTVPPPPVAAPASEVGDEPEPPSRPPPRQPLPSEPPKAPRFQVDWEEWIGIRGAAVGGGVVLALAGLFLFRYSIEHGLIPPWLRVGMGLLGGATCIAVSEWRLRGRYDATANGVAGAGTVILYASFWAAHGLYGLVGLELTFATMILVTVTCCALSWRYDALVIALIGLIGGFLTPFLLSTDADRPIGLFSYILLLDVGLLYMAARRSWPILAALSLAGTVVYQAGWIVARMGPDSFVLALGILLVFAIVFAFAARIARLQDEPIWSGVQAFGVLVPFLFGAFFAADAELTPHLIPVASLMLILGVAASWVSRVQRQPPIAISAAAATVGVVAVWLLRTTLTDATAWEVSGVAVVLAAGFFFFTEWNRGTATGGGHEQAALLTNFGFAALLLLVAAIQTRLAPWPWLAAWTVLSAMQLLHARRPRREILHIAAAASLGIGAAAVTLASPDPYGAKILAFDAPPYLGVLGALCVVFQVVALLPADAKLRAWRNRAAALLPLILLLSLVSQGLPQQTPPFLLLGAVTLLGSLAALAATRVPSGQWLAAAIAATALADFAWTLGASRLSFDTARIALVIQFATAQLFIAWPFLFKAPLRNEPCAWNAAALAGPAWFLPLRRLFEATFGDTYIAALPLLLAVSSLSAASSIRRIWPDGRTERHDRLVWFLAVAFGFITVAIPLQLEKSWITVGWALQGAAVTMLWHRFGHAGLKYFALALFAAVTARLVANPEVLSYYPRPEWRIVNWLLYTYLVPAAALLWSAVLLSRRELEWVRRWEHRFYKSGHPVAAMATGLAAVAIIFVWINLGIADWFATGPYLQLRFERLAARDLTTSIAWALYALLLLAAGVRFANRGLRWVSLGLMMITIVKVFLYDVGELDDLYRVASLLGLALSLILVSLAYQRFVKKAPVEGAG